MMDYSAPTKASPAIRPKDRSALRRALRRQALSVAVTMALGMAPAHAQVHPDGQTGTSTQTAANGVPVVNIAAPNQAGLSHNTYQQFDVDSNGLILNNSGAMSSTQLAGYVNGNPNLSAGQSATLILNEVSSTLPSHLAGAMEVAGTPAEVVVANPNGISCTGCGFINTPHAVLTTGHAVLDANGALSGFRVTGGALSVAGQGLDGSLVDQVDLIARAVSINAGVWAKRLNIVTGANQVSAGSLATQTVAGTGSTPAVALDVSALGGMYAGVIRLVGTEAGLGVNSQGQIAAQNGDLTLTSAGQVLLAGKTSATGTVTVGALQAVNNTGTLAAGGAVQVSSDGDITSSGVVYGGTSVTLQAGGAIANSGQWQAQAGPLTAQAAGMFSNAASASVLSGQSLAIGAGAFDNAGSIEGAQTASVHVGGRLTNSGQLLSDGGDLVLSAGDMVNSGVLSAGGNASLASDNALSSTGKLLAAHDLQIAAGDVVTAGAVQAGDALTLTAASLSNSGKLYALNGPWTARIAGQVSNAQAGDIYTKGGLQLTTASLVNDGGLGAAGTLELDSVGDIVNRGSVQSDGAAVAIRGQASIGNSGTISAAGDLALEAVSTLDTSGKVVAHGNVELSGSSLTTAGTVQAGQQLTLLSGSGLSNRGQLYALGHGWTAQLQGAFENQASGDVYSADALHLTAASIVNDGTLESAQQLAIEAAGDIANDGAMQSDHGTLAISSGGALTSQGALSAAGDLTLGAVDTLSIGGQVVGQGNVDLSGRGLSTSGSIQAGGALGLVSRAGLVNRGKLYALGGSWSADVADAFVNAAGGDAYASGDVLLTAGSLSSAGTFEAANGARLTVTGDLTNTGMIQADQGDVRIAADTFGNTGTLSASASLQANIAQASANSGVLVSGQAIDWTAGGFDNSQAGKLQGNGSVAFQVGELSNAGVIYGKGDVTLVTGDIANLAGAQLMADGAITFGGSGGLDNAGLVQAGADIAMLHGTSLSNRSGATLYAGASMALTLSAGLVNAGTLYASKGLDASVGDLSNDGVLRSGADLRLASAADIDTSKAIQAQHDLQLSAAGHLVNSGQLYAVQGDLTAQVGGDFQAATTSDIYSAGTLTLDSAGFANAGTLEAALAVTLNAAQDATNSGSMQADAGNLVLQGRTLANLGALSAAGDMDLGASQQLDNQGQVVAGKAMTFTAAHLVNGGEVQATGGLAIHAAALDNSGRLQAGDALQITGNNQWNNLAGGLAVAAGRLSADTSVLLQNDGVVQAGGELAVAGAGALDNRATGTLYSAAQTSLTMQGGLTNAGAIYGAQALSLAAGGLDNAGSLRTGGAMQVNIQGAASSSGIAYAGADSAWTVAGAFTDDGTLGAAGNTTVLANSLAGAGTWAAGLRDDGSLGTAGLLTLSTQQALAAHGRLLSGGDLVLSGSAIDLSGSQARAGGDASVTATSGDLSNQGGDLAANGQLSLTANGALLNGGGAALAGRLSAQSLRLQAASLDNRYGTLLQSGSSDLSLTFAGSLDNAYGTLAANAGNLTLAGASLDNTGGRIQHAGAGLLSLTSHGTLTNSGGSLASNGALTLYADGAVSNVGGTLGIAGSGQLTASAFDNSAGSLIADGLVLGVANALTNNAGTLQSGGALTLTAGSLGNRGGYLKATGQGDLSVIATGQLSNASASGTGGFIGGNGGVSIQAGSLANAAQIYAGGSLHVTTEQGVLSNDGGALQAQSSVSITSAQALSNQGGRIEAGAGNTAATLQLQALSLDNSGGRIANTGQGATTVGLGGSLLNRAGTLGGQGGVSLSASSLSNLQGGQVVAGHDLAFALGGLDNTASTIYAAGSIQWSNGAASLTNTTGSLGAGSTLALTLASVDNGAGALAAGGDVRLAFTGLSGDGRIVAGQDLTLALSSGFTNGAGNTLKANRDLALQLGGSFVNAAGATLSAVRTASVTATTIDNATNGRIDSADTRLSASGALTNEGRIEGDGVTLNSASLTNTGTLIGGSITAYANALTNGSDLGSATDNAAYQSALIAATEGIDLFVSGTLLNRDATIFTLGDLRIGADANGTRSQAVINRSGDIEASGNARIDTNVFTNQRRVFQTSVYNLSATEQAQNTSTGDPVAMYRYDDPDPLHHPPYVAASQVLNAQQIAALEGFCATQGSPGKDGDQWCNGPTKPGQSDSHNILHSDLRSITTSTLTSVERLEAASATSRLLASGDITLNGSVLNDKSTIAAGNNLLVNGQSGGNGAGSTSNETVQNIAWTPTGTVHQSINEQTGIEYVSFSGGRHWDFKDYETWGFDQASVQLGMGTGQPGWLAYDAGAGLAATMSAGNTVNITAHSIDNTVVGADGNPVHAVIGLGQNGGGQAVGGSAAGGVGSVGAGTGGVAGVSLGTAPGAASTGSLGVATGRGGVNSGQAPEAAQTSAVGTSAGSTPSASSVAEGHAPSAGTSVAPPQVVASLVGPNATVSLPQSGLYTVSSNPTSKYLVETDPRFTQYSQFISSDYMLQQLNVDTQTIEKRLGDGFYEQQQVLDQIASLTGRRFLDDNTDAMAQYRDLMNGGAQVAQSLDLSVGVALTAEQMANLTQDIVWLVSEKVDGQDVLVPVVYLSAANAKSLAANGATIAGKNVILTASGDINNQGTISASQSAQLTASNLLNSGAIHAGGDVSIQAAQNILNGGDIHGGGNVSLVAGNDVLSGVNVARQLGAVDLTGLGGPVSTVALTNLQPGSITAGGSLAIAAGRDLSLDTAPVAAGSNLSLAAGRDLTATATAIKAGGDAQLLAGRDLSLIATGHTVHQGEQANGVETTTHTISTLDAGGNLVLAAGRDLASQGAQLTAGNQLGLSAGRDVTLAALTDTTTQTTHTFQSHTQTTTTQRDEALRGTSLSGTNGVVVSAGHDLNVTAGSISSSAGAVALGAGHDLTLTAGTENHDTRTQTYTKQSGLLSSTTTTTLDTTHEADAIGTVISGDTVSLGAGHDLTAQAAQIAGTHDVTLAAGHNLTLTTADSTYSESHDKTKTKTGLMSGGGFSVMLGKAEQSQGLEVTQTTPTGSVVGSTDGQVTLSAGNDVLIHGSDVLSQTGTAIVGKNVTVDAAVGTNDVTQTQEQHSAGIHLGLTGGAATVAQSVAGSVQGAQHSDDARIKALYAMKAAQALYSAGAAQGMRLDNQDGAQALTSGSTTGISLRLGIGASSASSTSKSHDDTAYGSHIGSQGDVTIAATGGDLNVIGSAINGTNVALAASHDIHLLSQDEQHTDQSSSHNASGEVGVSLGQTTGLYATVSGGKATAHGNGTTHAESTITASDTLSLVSGNDTTIQGAQATGNTVLANIGGNLNLASEQDTDDYASHSAQGGVTAVYGFSGTGAGISGNLALSKADSHYHSVNEITGIGAGRGGFQIQVGGNTDLSGAVIASTADPSKNVLSTGTLSYSDLQNRASYSATSVNIGGSYGSGGGSFGAGPGSVPQSSDQSSTTRAGMAAGTIDVRDNPGQDLTGLDRTPTLANQALTNKFDPQKIAENQLLGQLLGQVGMTAVGDLEQQEKWEAGSAQSIALHTAAGALMAGAGGGNALQGALGAGAGEAGIPALEKYLGNSGIALGSTIIGGLVGGGSGAATANAGVNYNYLNHQQVDAVNQALANCGNDGDCKRHVLAQAEKLSANNDLALSLACQSGEDACAQGLGALEQYIANTEVPGFLTADQKTDKRLEQQGYFGQTSLWDDAKILWYANTPESGAEAGQQAIGLTLGTVHTLLPFLGGNEGLRDPNQPILPFDDTAGLSDGERTGYQLGQQVGSLVWLTVGDGAFAETSPTRGLVTTTRTDTAVASADINGGAGGIQWQGGMQGSVASDGSFIASGKASELSGGVQAGYWGATEGVSAAASGMKPATGTAAAGEVSGGAEEIGYVDILSPEAKQHILYGEESGSGGHMWPGQQGKTVFPQNWSAEKIVHEVGDIATSPATKWYAQTGTGGFYTSKGDPAKWVAYEVRDGVRIRVVYQPATGKVITAFPDNAPTPPYKVIK